MAGYVQELPLSLKKDEPTPDKDQQKGGAALGVPPAVVAIAAGLALDAVKKELDREAKKYERQSTARCILSLDDIGDSGYFIFARCTDKPGSKKESDSVQDKVSIDRGIEDIYSKLKESSDSSSGASSADVDAVLNKLVPKGKIPQSVLVVKMERARNVKTTIYKVSDAKLWVAGVGAKVVDFHWNPVSYLGALLLKTGNEAEVDLAMNVKALQLENLENPKSSFKSSWVQVEPSSTLVKGMKVNLSKPGSVYDAGSMAGSWMPIPSVAGEKGPIGFVEVTFSVTEKDPSNVKKYITEASEKIEENKESWIKKLTGQ